MPNENNQNSSRSSATTAGVIVGAAAAVAAFFVGRYTAPSQETEQQTSNFRTTDPTCSICRDNILVTTERYLRCGHVFHRECVETWLKTKRSCPNCNIRI